jgi:hypothetical protein
VSVLWLLQIGVVQISAAGCLWDDCMENIHARRVDCALEVGLGAALAPMWNQRFAAIPARRRVRGLAHARCQDRREGRVLMGRGDRSLSTRGPTGQHREPV